MNEVTETVRLTKYSHGGGCGCKISPKVLEEILEGSLTLPDQDKLLVGNSSRDDAAVYDIGDGRAIISTTDFFMPIVDDAHDFGRIAAANAISDIYAMGGRPLMAIAILGWPVEKLSAAIARQVIEGGRKTCILAGIPLAGGHSIDSPEPLFGLAVTGIVPIENIKKNDTSKEGDCLLLTKPLGVGILSTAGKRGQLKEDHRTALITQLSALNSIGSILGEVKGVNAMTDVTGFGLLGHLMEMASGSGLTAEISYAGLPVAEGVRDYIAQKIFPDATTRNWNSYSSGVKFEKGVNVLEAFTLLPDPQTNGGLLISVSSSALAEVQSIFKANGLEAFASPIGQMKAAADKSVIITP